MAPTWAEFNRLHMDDLNVGIVDCTDEGSRPICSRMEVRGYPTLIYFPSAEEGKKASDRLNAYKFQGPR